MKTKYPHYFDIAVTSYCQAICAGCQRNDIYGNKVPELVEAHMPLEKFEFIMDQIDSLQNCNGIRLCGELGDPMMHPKIEAIIDRIIKTTPNIEINTNGGLRKPAWYEYMAKKYQKTGNIQIEWGIDGIDHDTNWKYRRGVNWQRAMDNMTAWHQAGGSGIWSFLVFDWNYHQIPAAVAMANDIGIKLKFSITTSDNGLDGMIPGQKMDEAKKILREIGF